MLAPATFSAAHSMDTLWFAIDDDGHVAIMDSGEPGCAPVGAAQDFSEEQLNFLEARTEAIPSVVELVDRALEWLVDERVSPPVEQRGFFCFSAGANWRWPAYYERSVRPLRPLTARELPPLITAQACRLEGAHFAELPVIQPADFAPMKHWGTYWLSVRHWRINANTTEQPRRAPRLSEVRDELRRLRSDDDRALEIDAVSLVLSALEDESIDDPKRTLHALVRDLTAVTRRVLTDVEFAALQRALDAPVEEGDEIIASIQTRVQLRLNDSTVWARLPVIASDDDTDAAKRREWRAANESTVSRGLAPPSWLNDDARRYLPTSAEWHIGATLSDLARNGSISFALAPPSVFAAMALRSRDVIAAESIAREAARQRGADASVVYWRAVDHDELASVTDRTRDASPFDRALLSMGFAMDPVIRRVPALLIER